MGKEKRDKKRSDKHFMKMALKQAYKGQYTTSPNPAVGCVFVRNGKVIGKGYHHKAGQPHAEIMAMHDAHDDVAGATAYVTLEPCSHYGRTPPCAKALCDADVARVVIASVDPNPKVAGRGIAMLQEAGVEVKVGVCKREADELNRAFFKSIQAKRPYTLVKFGTTLDGKVALSNGDSKWITGKEARSDVQRLRLWSDAIITSHTTVKADNPQMSVRLNELPPKIADKLDLDLFSQPIKVIIDSHGTFCQNYDQSLLQPYSIFATGDNYIVVGTHDNFPLLPLPEAEAGAGAGAEAGAAAAQAASAKAPCCCNKKAPSIERVDECSVDEGVAEEAAADVDAVAAEKKQELAKTKAKDKAKSKSKTAKSSQTAKAAKSNKAAKDTVEAVAASEAEDAAEKAASPKKRSNKRSSSATVAQAAASGETEVISDEAKIAALQDAAAAAVAKKKRSVQNAEAVAAADDAAVDSEANAAWAQKAAKTAKTAKASASASTSTSSKAKSAKAAKSSKSGSSGKKGAKNIEVCGKVLDCGPNYLVEEWTEHVKIVHVPFVKGLDGKEHVSLEAVLDFLGSKEIRVAMVEAGAHLGSAFIDAGLVDELYVYQAPKFLGQSSLSAWQLMEPQTLDEALQGEVVDVRFFGHDLCIQLRGLRKGQTDA